MVERSLSMREVAGSMPAFSRVPPFPASLPITMFRKAAGDAPFSLLEFTHPEATGPCTINEGQCGWNAVVPSQTTAKKDGCDSG